MDFIFDNSLVLKIFILYLIQSFVPFLSINQRILKTTMVYRSLTQSFNKIAMRNISFNEGIELAAGGKYLSPNEEKDLHNFRIHRNRFIHSETNDIPNKVINRAQNIDQRLKNRIKANQNGKGFIYRLILFSIVIISVVYFMLIFIS